QGAPRLCARIHSRPVCAEPMQYIHRTSREIRIVARPLPYNDVVTRRPLRPTAEFDGTTCRSRPPGEGAAHAALPPGWLPDCVVAAREPGRPTSLAPPGYQHPSAPAE